MTGSPQPTVLLIIKNKTGCSQAGFWAISRFVTDGWSNVSDGIGFFRPQIDHNCAEFLNGSTSEQNWVEVATRAEGKHTD
jgi:hypothetical protein